MKKSVVILIAIIYVASIALVSFFGLKFKSYNEKIYVEKIEITNDDVRISDKTGAKSVLLYPDSRGELIYKIEYELTPSDASASDIEFRYDKEINYVSVGSDGTVVFNKELMGARGAIKITVASTDGTEASDSITIYAFAE